MPSSRPPKRPATQSARRLTAAVSATIPPRSKPEKLFTPPAAKQPGTNAIHSDVTASIAIVESRKLTPLQRPVRNTPHCTASVATTAPSMAQMSGASSSRKEVREGPARGGAEFVFSSGWIICPSRPPPNRTGEPPGRRPTPFARLCNTVPKGRPDVSTPLAPPGSA